MRTITDELLSCLSAWRTDEATDRDLCNAFDKFMKASPPPPDQPQGEREGKICACGDTFTKDAKCVNCLIMESNSQKPELVNILTKKQVFGENNEQKSDPRALRIMELFEEMELIDDYAQREIITKKAVPILIEIDKELKEALQRKGGGEGMKPVEPYPPFIDGYRDPTPDEQLKRLNDAENFCTAAVSTIQTLRASLNKSTPDQPQANAGGEG